MRVRKRTKTAIKILVGSVTGLAVIALLLFIWYSRAPTTQLIDATGNELTAGDASDAKEDGLGGSIFEEALAFIEKKDFAAAKERLLQVISEYDRDGEACILLCDVSRGLEEVEAAVDYGLKAVELLPDSAEAHLSYAKALGAQLASSMQSISGIFSAMTRLGLFKTELNRVIELNPEDIEARTLLVYTNLAPMPIGNIDRAIEVSREIELRDPVSGKQLLAACFNRKNESERAIALLLEGVEQYPDENGFHIALADIYAEQERFDDADAEYEAARNGEKNDAYYRSLYGQARMRIMNKFEPGRAVELLDQFIADQPEGDTVQSVAHACWRKGNALEQLGRNADAREAYEESLRKEPGLKLAEKAIADLKD